MNFILYPTKTPLAIEWDKDISIELKAMADLHSRPCIKWEDIEEGKIVKGNAKKWPYYFRSAKTALIFSNSENIKTLIVKNPLAITTFFVMLEEVYRKPFAKKN